MSSSKLCGKIGVMERDAVAEIKERLSIQDVVAPHVKLVRAGKSLVGLCPFHKEKTGSFHVSPERNSYHCFGCGEGGDIFSFIEKIEGVDFKGALKMLAEKAGVTLSGSTRGGEHTGKKERLREIMARAAHWYVSQLPGSAAETYAKKRGLTPETMQYWGIGYAPDAWRSLLEAFAAENYSTTELSEAGLIKEAEGKRGTYYDRFRDRLIFPIRDVAGRIVAFTGRSLPKNKKASKEQEIAKYLNSPETLLYHKSEVLFGLDRAKDAIRQRGFTLLVEGQMDVLHAHQAGFENTVALSGTAFTEKHIALLKRYSENLMLVLDADAAGLAATGKSAQLALKQGLRVKATTLPAGKDPADVISVEPKDFAKRLKSATPIVDFMLSTLAEREPDPHRLLRLAERIVLPLIASISSPMEREHFAQSAARTLGLSTEAVLQTVVRLPRSQEDSVEEPVTVTNPGETGRSSVTGRETRERQLLAAVAAYPNSPLAKRIKTEYARIVGVRPASKLVPSESAIFEAEQAFGEDPEEEAADELLRAFEAAVIREAYQEAVVNLRKAEASQDVRAVKKAQTVCTELAVRLAHLGQ